MTTHESLSPSPTSARLLALAIPVFVAHVLAGCAGPAATLKNYGVYSANVVTVDRPQRDPEKEENFYNGEPVKGSKTDRTWSMAWVDYDAQFARYYIESVEQLAPSGALAATAVLGAALPDRIVSPAPVDYNARFVRHYSAGNLLSRALGFRSFQSPGLSVAGLIVGNLDPQAAFFRIESKQKFQYRTGSSLTLVRMLADQKLLDPSKDAQWGVELLSGALAIPGTPLVVVSQDAASVERKTSIVPPAKVGMLPPGMPGGNSLDMYALLTSKSHKIYHQTPGATLYPDGITTTVVIPHIAYQGRADGIVSARELYEKKLRDNPLVGPEWIVIYTDRNEKGEWAVFVTRQGDNRVIEFPLPTPFPI